MLGKLITVCGVLLLGYLSVIALLYQFQSKLMYFPTRAITRTPDLVGLEYADVWLRTRDGVRIHGWYVPVPRARWTVLMLHGNAGNVSDRLRTLALFAKLGVNTLIIDYRGYGLSDGQPTEAGTYEDALAAWRYLTEHHAADSIVLFGRSLGGAVAVRLAADTSPAGLILESTFSSAADLAQHHYPLLPLRYLLKFRYDSLAETGDIRCPVLMVHSRDDRVVPFESGVKLFEALPGRKQFVEIRGGHNDTGHFTDETYTGGLGNFFASL